MRIMIQAKESSQIDEIAYSEEEQILIMRFNTGGVYEYFDVPPKIVASLFLAESSGAYWSRMKNKFNYKKVGS